jgi:glycerol-3-phosphate dehydrogenase
VGVIHELKQGHAVTSEVDVSDWKLADLHSHKANPRRNSSASGNGGNGVGDDLYNPNLLLRDFLQERWKGVVPIVWGQQLKQEQLDQLIYLDIMNADHLPDAGLKSPLTDFYHMDVTPNDHLEESHD